MKAVTALSGPRVVVVAFLTGLVARYIIERTRRASVVLAGLESAPTARLMTASYCRVGDAFPGPSHPSRRHRRSGRKIASLDTRRCAHRRTLMFLPSAMASSSPVRWVPSSSQSLKVVVIVSEEVPAGMSRIPVVSPVCAVVRSEGRVDESEGRGRRSLSRPPVDLAIRSPVWIFTRRAVAVMLDRLAVLADGLRTHNVDEELVDDVALATPPLSAGQEHIPPTSGDLPGGIRASHRLQLGLSEPEQGLWNQVERLLQRSAGRLGVRFPQPEGWHRDTVRWRRRSTK